MQAAEKELENSANDAVEARRQLRRQLLEESPTADNYNESLFAAACIARVDQSGRGIDIKENLYLIQRPPTKEYCIVEEGIEKYIEELCIEACKKLWVLNIATLESSGDQRRGWIALDRCSLNDANLQRLKEAVENDVDGYSDHVSYKGYVGIVVRDARSAQEVSDRLLDLVGIFEMQDTLVGVYDKEGFLTSECDCRVFDHMEKDGTFVFVFDPSKMNKSFEEYIKEKGAVYDVGEDKVYLNDYYYQKHQNYLKYKAEQELDRT